VYVYPSGAKTPREHVREICRQLRTERRRRVRMGRESKESEMLTRQKKGGPFGENLGSGYESGGATVTAWGNESSKYDFKAAEFRSVS
jgi:hypothetical protein